jgi:hypothetical protein
MDENEFASRLEELVVAKLSELPAELSRELEVNGQVLIEEFDLSLRLGDTTVRLRGREDLVRVDVD